ncbi:MAG: AAA family ATPase, partial [Gemmatimonadota bacterium]|nr:AAA family ATPase [Gemmatimonadota bacterium]
MSSQDSLFADSGLPPQLVADLRDLNPWWEGDPMPLQPQTRRHLVAQMRRRLDAEIAPIIVVRGPRQVGKTTAQFQIIADLLDEGVPPTSILRVQFEELASLQRIEDPILAISRWFERKITGARFNALARDGQKAYLFFDEIQNLDGWDAQLKFLVDNASVKVVVTGSSALRIERGRDSLAGRINTIEAGVLSLTEIGALRGLETAKPFLQDNGLRFLIDKNFWRELRAHGEDNT